MYILRTYVKRTIIRKKMIIIFILHFLLYRVQCFWDVGTTTPHPLREDRLPRTSFFRWQITEFESTKFWCPHFDWDDIERRRRLNVIAGVSIDFVPLSTATIMNRRHLITAANFLDPHIHRQRDLRVWCLGRAGMFNTPYRYRVHRAVRVFPRSSNPEHQHGPRGSHVPRHDVAVIITLDQIYIWSARPYHYQYAFRATLTKSHQILEQDLVMAGSGYEYMEHILQNYKIFYALLSRDDIVDCSIYLPKWWGKFICIKNVKRLAGIQNGGALMTEYTTLVGVGCFEIRYNEDRIYVFTDLRYYVHWIYKYAHIYPGQYYEYAYPQWSQGLGGIYDGNSNNPYIPIWQIQQDLYPLGK